MKLNPRVSQLALYDIRLGPGPWSAALLEKEKPSLTYHV